MTRLDPRPSAPGLAQAYGRYFGSGTYDRRYPRANPRVMARIRTALPRAAHVIDYGCGSGRYLLPLRGEVARAAGFDVCETALGLLAQRAAATGGAPLHVLGPAPAAVARHVDRHGQADLVLCLFGVLAHVTPLAARRQVLRRLRAALKPTGLLILSVPSRRRRFRAEQRGAGDGANDAIFYTRQTAEGPLQLPYQLFDSVRLRSELSAAGFHASCVVAESVLPEASLTNSRPLATLDRGIAPFCPADWGYGLLAEATPS